MTRGDGVTFHWCVTCQMRVSQTHEDHNPPIIVATDEDMAAFWWHLTDAHGLNASGTHGDPFLMHGAIGAFGLCERRYMRAPA